MKRKIIGVILLTLVLLTVMVAGCAGEEGAKGLKGATGAQGIQGEQGLRGGQGLRGLQGEQGEAGLQGVTGAKGATGVTGLTGAAGADGEDGATGEVGLTGADGSPLNYLVLVAKDSSDWSIKTDSGVGYLLYSMKSPTFNYTFWATGLEDAISYSLIYYPDTENRYVDWGGAGGKVIATFSSEVGGSILLQSGEVELNMSMPSEDDANINFYNYTLAPDNYAHPFGAKIWLVPTTCLTAGDLPLASWTPDRFLFETDLIYYINTD